MRIWLITLSLLCTAPAWAGKAFEVDEASTEELVAYLDHADWRFRYDAAVELGKRKRLAGEEQLAQLANVDGEARVRRGARAALEKMGSANAVLVAEAQVLDDPEAGNRKDALATIERAGDARSALIVAAALAGDPEPGVRGKAAAILGKRKWADGGPALAAAAKGDDDDGVRRKCLEAIARIGDPAARVVLHEALANATDDKERLSLIKALGAAPIAADREVLLGALDDPYSHVARHAARALVKLGDASVVDTLRSRAASASVRKVAEEFEEAADKLGR